MSDFRSNIISILDLANNKTIRNATKIELYNAILKSIIKNIQDKQEIEAVKKNICCISMEYPIGNIIYRNLANAGLDNQFAEIMTEYGMDTNIFEDMPDVGCGFTNEGFIIENFMDSITMLNLDFTAYGLHYKYGYYKQVVEDGKMKTCIDEWKKHEDLWSKRVEDEKVVVKFKEHEVYAIPYDIYMVGYGTKRINKLRLWQAESIDEFDYELFNTKKCEKAFSKKNQAEIITSIFFSNADEENLQNLKMKQEYFLVSASLQDIIRQYKEKGHENLSKLAEEYAVLINGIESAFALPEFARILVEQEKMTFNKSFKIMKEIFSYISMKEKVQVLNGKDMKAVSQSLYKYTSMINKAFIKKRMNNDGEENFEVEDVVTEDIEDIIINFENSVNLFNMVKFVCTNDKMTIGCKEISQRNWLQQINKELVCFLNDKISNVWLTNMERLSDLEKYLDDDNTVKDLLDIKMVKKRQLVEYIENKEKIRLNKEFIFRYVTKDIIKNVNKIKNICNNIRTGKVKNFYPTVYMFAIKPLPNNENSKKDIESVFELVEFVKEDSLLSELINVVFLTNYNTSYERKVIPAVDIIDDFEDVRFLLNGAIYKEVDDCNVEDKLEMVRRGFANIVNSSGFSIDKIVRKYKESVWKVQEK